MGDTQGQLISKGYKILIWFCDPKNSFYKLLSKFLSMFETILSWGT